MKIPDGWFIRDMIIFNEPDERGWAAKGYTVEIPDFSNASNSVRNELHSRLMLFLSMIRSPLNMQFQWSVDSDYRHELLLYDSMTELRAKNKWTYSTRKERFNRYWGKMAEGRLRREKLRIYLSTPISMKAGLNMAADELEHFYDNLLQTLSTFFANQSSLLCSILGPSGAGVVPMDDREHYLHYAKFLNPNYRLRSDYDPLSTFDGNLGIQANCWHSSINGNSFRNSQDYSFFMDGYYHGVIVINRWPQNTYPGIIRHLTGLPMLDYSITMDIWPQKIEDEIRREESAIERISGDYHSEKKHSLLTALDKKHRKVNALAGGFTYPFKVLTVIRTWALTKEELTGKCSAIKSAVNLMNGAGYWESLLPTSSMNLFFMTWPGWTFGEYAGHAIYAENQYLADMLPVSATFTGHLEGAEAIYDGDSFNLIGIRNFIGNTPQHAALFGMSGAGKSAFMVDLLSQTECFYGYTCIIEEGLGYANYAKTLDSRPIVIHPDCDFTINYLDTNGLPLSPFHLSMATALLVRMAGACSDEDRRNLRSSQIMQYLDQLYTDTYDEWIKGHEELLPEIIKKAIFAKHLRENVLPPGNTVADAFLEMRERLERNDGESLESLYLISEQQMTEFSKDYATENLIRDMAFTYFKPEEYPTHSALQEMMLIAPSRQHDRDEVKRLATLISSWCAHGQYGKIFDGCTNISLAGRMAHFELGRIPEAASELKKMVGFLIGNHARNHIMTLPRNTRKRCVFEEAGRMLDIDGGERLISECYAQMRKYNTWIVSIVQQYSKFKQTPIRPVIMGNSKQFFLMKQNDRTDLADIARDIDLSEAVQEQIMNYPSPENLPEAKRFSSFTYYHLDVRSPLCGTGRNCCSPEMLECSSADGAHFEKHGKELKSFENDGITKVKMHLSNGNKEEK